MDGGIDAMDAQPAPQPLLDWTEESGVLGFEPVDPCASCVATSECETASCVDGVCHIDAVADTTLCGEMGFHCVRGTCRERGCGDGYREPGPEPMREACDDGNAFDGDACDFCMQSVATLASREDGYDALLGPGAVGVDAGGHALIVWASEDGSGDEPVLRLLAQRFEYGGSPVGEPLAIAGPFPLGADLTPKVGGLNEGWAVAWIEEQEAVVRRVLTTGTMSPERRSGEGVRDVALAREGAELLLLLATSESLELQRFDADFMAQRLRSLVAGDIRQVDAASSRDGWAVTWAEAGIGEAPWDVVVRARIIADETISRDISPGPGVQPAIAAIAGGYALAWSTPVPDPRGDIWTRSFSSDGTLGEATLVADRTPYAESAPTVAGLGGGWFVGWHERGEQGGAGLVAIQAESPESAPIEERLAPPGDHGGLALASGADGRAWVAWSVGPPFGEPGASRSSFFTILSEASR